MTAVNLEGDVKIVVDKLGASVVRTVVPYIIGLIVAAAARLGLHVDTPAYEAAIALGVSTLYYAGVRYLETFVKANYGKLLGHVGAPKYVTDQIPAVADAAVNEVGKYIPAGPAVVAAPVKDPASYQPTHLADVPSSALPAVGETKADGSA